jgi:hypothetical protein
VSVLYRLDRFFREIATFDALKSPFLFKDALLFLLLLLFVTLPQRVEGYA